MSSAATPAVDALVPPWFALRMVNRRLTAAPPDRH